eukprot:gene14022-29854_t
MGDDVLSTMFDIVTASELILRLGFKRVVLQFPDEYLHCCMEIFQLFREKLDSSVDIYIAADSTYGSSVDDVSALHVNSDILIYFGTDMSSSGSMPVLVLPPKKNINIDLCITSLMETLLISVDISVNKNILLLSDPSFYSSLNLLSEKISSTQSLPCLTGQIPYCANLNDWSINPNKTLQNPNMEQICSMLVDKTQIELPSTIIIYIGETYQKVVPLLLRFSQNKIIFYNTKNNESNVYYGENTRDFNERYGGVSHAKDAQIIGIIIGSMGLTGTIIQETVSRLQKLIIAAGKKYYTFVMGRINEAKLSNFPE